MWYNKNVKRGRELKNNAKTQKEKNLKNPLDNPSNLWYNKYVSERDKSPLNISLAATKRRENLVANIL